MDTKRSAVELIGDNAISEHGVRNPRTRARVKALVTQESRTVQSYRDATDINNIVAHFHRTGEFPFTAVARQTPQYADVSNISHKNFQELAEAYAEAHERLTSEELRLAESVNQDDPNDPVSAPPPGETPPTDQP